MLGSPGIHQHTSIPRINAIIHRKRIHSSTHINLTTHRCTSICAPPPRRQPSISDIGRRQIKQQRVRGRSTPAAASDFGRSGGRQERTGGSSTRRKMRSMASQGDGAR
uniref:Uncharacterized protein n=1 Tax=Oryza nivara TaxID=4536 RepID=A0A0E0HEY7_ORYNI